jgi:hypothetical protein
MLPSELSQLSASAREVINSFPSQGSTSLLCRADLSFLFRLVGLKTCSVLQAPCPLPSENKNVDDEQKIQKNKEEANENFVPSLDLLESVGAFNKDNNENSSDSRKPLNLRSLMEAIHKGRLFILNAQQSLAFVSIALNIIALWSLYSLAVPLSIPPALSTPLELLFVCIYTPGGCICFHCRESTNIYFTLTNQ